MSSDTASLDLPVAGPFKRVKELPFEEALRILLTCFKNPPPGFEHLKDLIPDGSDADDITFYINGIIGQLKQRPQIIEYQTKNGVTDDEVKALHVYKCECPYPVYKWLNAWLMSSRRDEEVQKAIGPFFIILNRAMSKLPKVKSKAARAIKVRNIPALRATFDTYNHRCAPGNQLSFWGFASFSTDDQVINSSQFMVDIDEQAFIFSCGMLEGVDMEPFAPSGMKEKEILPMCPTIFEVQSAVTVGSKLIISVKQLDNFPFAYVRVADATTSTETKKGLRDEKTNATQLRREEKLCSQPQQEFVEERKVAQCNQKDQIISRKDQQLQQQSSEITQLRQQLLTLQLNNNCRVPSSPNDKPNLIGVAVPNAFGALLNVTNKNDTETTTNVAASGAASVVLKAPPKCDDAGFLKLVADTNDIDTITHLHFCDPRNPIDCRITDKSLEFIAATFPKIVGLDLQWSKDITDAGIRSVSKISSVTSLVLSYCDEITDVGLEYISKLSRITALDLSHCRKITDAGLMHLSELSCINSLQLAECPEITDAGLEPVSKLSGITHLDLTFCNKITDVGLERIVKLSGITFLDMYYCIEITDVGLESVSKLSRISYLNLTGCDKITDAGLEFASKLGNITKLNLIGCDKITDAGLEFVSKLGNITSLSLSCCDKITDAGLEHISRMKSITSLAIFDSKITAGGTTKFKEARPNCKVFGLQTVR